MNKRWKEYRHNTKIIGMSRYNALVSSGFPMAVCDRYRMSELSPPFIDIFEQKGWSDRKKVEHVLGGLNADKVVSVETDQTSKSGKPIYRNVTIPDWAVRHKYLETMLKLCRQLDEKKDSTTVVFDLAERLKVAREKHNESVRVLGAQFRNNTIEVSTANEGPQMSQEAPTATS